MNDLISRQALCEYALNQKDKSVTPNDIMRFPSAQPDVPDTNVGDMISRQEAIDVLDAYQVKIENGEKNPYAWARLRMSELPSTQLDTDCISRKAAIDGLNDAVHEHNITDFDAVATILALPSVTPKQRTGKWIDLGDCEQCSKCKGTHLKEIQTVYGKATWIKSKFCPNCGAKMEVTNAELD